MAVDAQPTPIVPPYVPIIDPRTGQMDRAWYMFFLSLFRGLEVPDLLLKGPAVQDQSGALAQSIQTAQLAAQASVAQTEEQAIQTAQLAAQMNITQAEVAALQTAVQALALAPANTPQLQQRRYGSFFDTTTQTAALANTAYAMTFNTTDLSVGVYVGSPTSRIYVDRGGVYNIQFSAQLDLAAGGGDYRVWIWLRVNGTDVANTASEERLKGNDAEVVAAWNFLYNFKAGDYFELMWAAEDTDLVLKAVAAAPPVPAIPSVILTVTDNISPYQD